MSVMTITIDPDELLGLSAVAELGEVTREDDGEADPASTAKVLMHTGLAARLDELGLPWAPSAEVVHNRAAGVPEPDDSRPPGALRRFIEDARVRKYGTTVLLVAALVVLWGGYIQGWEWTGFPANNQLWDWLHLLLLPVVFGTLPLWIQHADYMSRTRRATYLAAIAAFIGFVLVGYLAPLAWTGFPGNTLWNWFELIVLPVALISVRAWPSAGRPVHAQQKAGIALLALAWVVTLIGGYVAKWSWTGYPGNTLWDWLQLLLLPLVFPAILLPAMLKWVSGNAAELAEKARKDRESAAGTPALDQAKI
jgi:hypothetical protein